MKIRQYLVDAFTDKVFSGNPAAVCVLDEWPDEHLMKNIALENNLSETAFVVKEPEAYHLRWFTPKEEINLCGHATLATAFVLLNFCGSGSDTVEFDTLSGKLSVTRKGDLYEMDFPTYALKEIPVTAEMEQAFGARPSKALLAMDLICVFDDEQTVRRMQPDLSRIEQLPGILKEVRAGDGIILKYYPLIHMLEKPGNGRCRARAAAEVFIRVVCMEVAWPVNPIGNGLFDSLAIDEVFRMILPRPVLEDKQISGFNLPNRIQDPSCVIGPVKANQKNRSSHN